MERILNAIEETREYIARELRHNRGSFSFNAEIREHVFKNFSALMGRMNSFMEANRIKYNYSTASSKMNIIDEAIRNSSYVIKMLVGSNASYEENKASSNLYFNLTCGYGYSVEDVLEAFDEFKRDMKFYDDKENLLSIGYHGVIVLDVYDRFFREVFIRIKEYIKESNERTKKANVNINRNRSTTGISSKEVVNNKKEGSDMVQENEVDLSFLNEEEPPKPKEDLASSDAFFDEVISSIKAESISTPITSDNLDYINPNYRVKKEDRADSHGSSESSFNGDVNTRLVTLEEKVDKILEILSQR